MRLICSLWLFFLMIGCVSTTPKVEPREITDAQKEMALDIDLRPVLAGLISQLAGQKVAVLGFFAEGTKIEPRMAAYIRPRIESNLLGAKVQLLDRKDLKSVVREQIFDPKYQQKTGELLGADFLILGVIKDMSLNSYHLEVRVLSVDTGEVVASPFCIIDKKHLPIRYGGK